MNDPYALLPAIYEAELGEAAADVAGYARRGVPGRLLVGGCGTGRVNRGLAPLRAVVGLDRSAPMLAYAQERDGALAGSSSSAGPRPGGPPGSASTYILGDLTTFDLGSFAEIVIPNGSFAFLPDRRAQAACLRRCAAALPRGAPLTIDLPMPDFGLLGAPHTPERPAWRGLVAGVPWARTREVFRAPIAQSLRLVDRYYRDGVLEITSELPLALVFPREAEWLLETNGFYLEAAWGDHAEGPLREGCDRLLLYAIRG